MSTALMEKPAAPVVTAEPTGPGVYRCIARVSGEIAKEGIAKSRSNQQQGYKFRGIDEVYNALAPLLAKHGLVILPRMLSRELTERQAKGGGALFNVVVEAEFDFVCAEDGSTHTVRMFGEAMDSADKATNKAMSAAYKYAAFQTFCIPTEGDNDADSHTPQLEAPAPTERGNPAAGESARSRVAPSGGETSGHLGQLIRRVDEATTKNGRLKWYLHFEDGVKASTISATLAASAQQYCERGTRVQAELKTTQWGHDVLKLFPVAVEEPDHARDQREPDESDIPFVWLLAMIAPLLGMLA